MDKGYLDLNCGYAGDEGDEGDGSNDGQLVAQLNCMRSGVIISCNN